MQGVTILIRKRKNARLSHCLSQTQALRKSKIRKTATQQLVQHCFSPVIFCRSPVYFSAGHQRTALPIDQHLHCGAAARCRHVAFVRTKLRRRCRRGSGTASSIDRQTPLWTSLCLRLEPLQLLYAIECLCINQRWQRFRGAAAALPAVVLWHSAVLAMRSGVMVLSMCTNLVLQVVNHGETIGRFQGEHTSLVCSVKTGK